MRLLEHYQQKAATFDQSDELKSFQDEFHFPTNANGEKSIYFCGNSLGLQPIQTAAYIQQELEDWAKLGVEGHVDARHPWMPYHEFVTKSMAHIVGAKSSEVVVMNSLTVNLHLLMVSFYRPTPKRYKILIEANAFPSDRYAVESQLKFHGYDPAEGLVVLPTSEGKAYTETQDILNYIDEHGDELALILIGGVNYYSGQAFPLKAITELGHQKGCVVGFDLAHGAGNIICDLHDNEVDFAAWCTYKYLNSGPGGLSGIFVHEKHGHNFELPRFAGWWGHNKSNRFKMPDEFEPMPGAEGWQLSNPPILPLAALRSSLEQFERADIHSLRKKSEQLTSFLYDCVQALEHPSIEIITPAETQHRGCQLSIRVKNADKGLFDQLTAQNVIADWREPDVIRIAPVPLYNSFTDCYMFTKRLEKCLDY